MSDLVNINNHCFNIRGVSVEYHYEQLHSHHTHESNKLFTATITISGNGENQRWFQLFGKDAELFQEFYNRQANVLNGSNLTQSDFYPKDAEKVALEDLIKQADERILSFADDHDLTKPFDKSALGLLTTQELKQLQAVIFDRFITEYGERLERLHQLRPYISNQFSYGHYGTLHYQNLLVFHQEDNFVRLGEWIGLIDQTLAYAESLEKEQIMLNEQREREDLIGTLTGDIDIDDDLPY